MVAAGDHGDGACPTGMLSASSVFGKVGCVRLVLADDHRMLRESLGSALESRGFEVVGEAGDGSVAVQKAVELSPDVVLMDVTMPVLDGVEATRRIRLRLPEVRVVMLTMHAGAIMKAAGMRAGASAYLVKDCSVEQIATTVQRVASGPPGASGEALSMLEGLPHGICGDAGRTVSRREEEVLQLLADGCSSAEVAERLFISSKTVKNHLASIYHKLDTPDRTQAVLRALRMGVVRFN